MELFQGCDECGEVKELCVCTNEQQIIETLATKVMGWHEEEMRWADENGDPIYLERWNPLQNIADAWQLVEKFDYYQMEKRDTEKHVCFLAKGEKWIRGEGKTAQEAICNAAYKLVA